MDWLRIAVAAMGVVYLFAAVIQPFGVGTPRNPRTSTDAGCGIVISLVFFALTLLVWQRLGGG